MPAGFDAAAFAEQMVGPVEAAMAPFLAKAGEDALALVAEVAAFKKDVAGTIAAFPTATPSVLKLLQDDIATFFPARRDAILAQAEAIGATDMQAALEVALEIAVKVGVAVAKSFIPIP
jgi:hypothetical protein